MSYSFLSDIHYFNNSYKFNLNKWSIGLIVSTLFLLFLPFLAQKVKYKDSLFCLRQANTKKPAILETISKENVKSQRLSSTWHCLSRKIQLK